MDIDAIGARMESPEIGGLISGIFNSVTDSEAKARLETSEIRTMGDLVKMLMEIRSYDVPTLGADTGIDRAFIRCLLNNKVSVRRNLKPGEVDERYTRLARRLGIDEQLFFNLALNLHRNKRLENPLERRVNGIIESAKRDVIVALEQRNIYLNAEQKAAVQALLSERIRTPLTEAEEPDVVEIGLMTATSVQNSLIAAGIDEASMNRTSDKNPLGVSMKIASAVEKALIYAIYERFHGPAKLEGKSIE